MIFSICERKSNQIINIVEELDQKRVRNGCYELRIALSDNETKYISCEIYSASHRADKENQHGHHSQALANVFQPLFG